MPHDHDPRVDLGVRVLQVALAPGLELARTLSMPLSDVVELSSTGYFNVFRKRGLSWEQIARRIGRSRRNVAQLAQKDTKRPLENSPALRLRRRLVELLSSGHLAEDELAERLGKSADFVNVSKDELADALEALRAAGVVVGDADGWGVHVQLVNLVEPDVDHRVAALQHFIDTVTEVIRARFLSTNTEREAFARVLTFSIDPGRMENMPEEIYAAIESRALAEDKDCGADAKQVSVVFSVVERTTG